MSIRSNNINGELLAGINQFEKDLHNSKDIEIIEWRLAWSNENNTHVLILHANTIRSNIIFDPVIFIDYGNFDINEKDQFSNIVAKLLNKR